MVYICTLPSSVPRKGSSQFLCQIFSNVVQALRIGFSQIQELVQVLGKRVFILDVFWIETVHQSLITRLMAAHTTTACGHFG